MSLIGDCELSPPTIPTSNITYELGDLASEDCGC